VFRRRQNHPRAQAHQSSASCPNLQEYFARHKSARSDESQSRASMWRSGSQSSGERLSKPIRAKGKREKKGREIDAIPRVS
jgi:hypothetical protein